MKKTAKVLFIATLIAIITISGGAGVCFGAGASADANADAGAGAGASANTGAGANAGVGISVGAGADPGPNASAGAVAVRFADPERLAAQLKELGMFKGVGEKADGTATFDLDRAPTRAEAVVMLIRALGKDQAAAAYKKTHPFTDVPAWADGYISYAYDNGLTSGVSEKLFDSGAPVSAQMYVTFCLRALGYKDGAKADFYWNSPWAFAALKMLLPSDLNLIEFKRSDAVILTSSALYAKINGTQAVLYERLISEGAFTESQFNKAFPAEPFSDFRRIYERVSEIIDEREQMGPLRNDSYVMKTFLIDSVGKTGGALYVTANIGIGEAKLDENNAVSAGGKNVLWLIGLDPETLGLLSCQRSDDDPVGYRPLEDVFPEDVINRRWLIGAGLGNVCESEAQKLVDGGLFKYRKPSYADSLAELKSRNYLDIYYEMETGQCTILYATTVGTTHNGGTGVYLVFKPGSVLGEGEVRIAKTPWTDEWGRSAAPTDLTVSEDGLALHYTAYIDGDIRVHKESGEVSGIYNFTVDLTTGETSYKLAE